MKENNNEHKNVLARSIMVEDVLDCIKRNWWEYYQSLQQDYDISKDKSITFGITTNIEEVLKLWCNTFEPMPNEYFEDIDKIFKDNKYLDL